MIKLTCEKYFKTKKRMIKEEDGVCGINCEDCPLSRSNNQKDMICTKFELHYTDEAIAIVRKWAKEHPLITNLQHYADRLRKIGFHVKEEQLKNACPVPYYDDFGDEIPRPNDSCKNCQKWWDEEYIPAGNSEE